MSGEAVLEVVTARRAILERLATDALGSGELAAELERSRSTVDRALSDLEAIGLIERTNGRYRTTVAGALALEEFDRLTSRLTAAVGASHLFAPIATDVPLGARFLEGSDVVLTSASEPLGPTEHAARLERIEPERALEELLATGEHHRAVVPAVGHRIITAYRDAIREGISLAAALPSADVETLLADHRRSTIAALETGRLTIRETETTTPHALIVAERADGGGLASQGAEAAAIVAVCVDDAIHGLVVNDTPAALEWARARLDTVWANARLLSPEPEEG
ncbi:helix-turn-helix transcriptional regulator [Natronococcus wangiae]|uniref:helix-turn-helix transcriptional regulator n=1 Tax=Natronococcus wangiae TaxID=3068275 RepID=UPI00273FE452|nr:winged helix-turn-helix domain-containing protein [Natronococcus sp. AD5]